MDGIEIPYFGSAEPRLDVPPSARQRSDPPGSSTPSNGDTRHVTTSIPVGKRLGTLRRRSAQSRRLADFEQARRDAAADRESAARERVEAQRLRDEAATMLTLAATDELTGAWSRRLGYRSSREPSRGPTGRRARSSWCSSTWMG